MRRLFVAGIALACMSAPAFASHHREHHSIGKASSHHGRHYARHSGAWCGAYMRHVYGISDPRLNLARNWASVGSNAGGPRVGAVVVWPHHVGVIRGGPDSNGEWLVESGNDGHAVRTRYRSLRGAVAFRYVSGGGLTFNSGQQHYARYSSSQNDFIWARANMATSTDDRRRYVHVAQTWTAQSDRRFYW
jgi:hypothetical protein